MEDIVEIKIEQNPVKFISTEELDKLRKNHYEKIQIWDCSAPIQNSETPKKYWADKQTMFNQCHIEGALLFNNFGRDMHPQAGRRDVPKNEAVCEFAQRRNFQRTMRMVLYDKQAGVFAGLAAMRMYQFGHPDVLVLSGGFQKWLAEGRAVSNHIIVEGSLKYEKQYELPVVTNEEFYQILTKFGDAIKEKGKIEDVDISEVTDMQIIDIRKEDPKRPKI